MKPRAICYPWLLNWEVNMLENDNLDLQDIVTIIAEKDKILFNPFANVPKESIEQALDLIECVQAEQIKDSLSDPL
jgi:hypothetical protein